VDKEKIRVVFLIPFYDQDINQLFDTIDSILYYSHGRYKIICVNDCQEEKNIKNIEKKLGRPEIEIFTPVYNTEWPRNGYGALFCKLYQAIKYALENCQFDYLVKLDTDALLTGSELLDFVDSYYSKINSDIGFLGSYRIKCDGSKRTHWEWRIYLLFLVYIAKKLSRKSKFWKKCLPMAKKNGYKLGESMLGGAYICTYTCLQTIINIYPPDFSIKDQLYLTKIGEDVIFTLLAFAGGYKIDDFGRPGDPMAIGHNKLPIRKEDIIKKQKQIIHSVKKGLYGESEDELRSYFRRIRKFGHS